MYDQPNALNSLPVSVILIADHAQNSLARALGCQDLKAACVLIEDANGFIDTIVQMAKAAVTELELTSERDGGDT